MVDTWSIPNKHSRQMESGNPNIFLPALALVHSPHTVSLRRSNDQGAFRKKKNYSRHGIGNNENIADNKTPRFHTDFRSANNHHPSATYLRSKAASLETRIERWTSGEKTGNESRHQLEQVL